MVDEEKFEIELKFHADVKVKLHTFSGEKVFLSFHNICDVFKDDEDLTVVTFRYEDRDYDNYYVRESVEEVNNLRTQALNHYRKIIEFCSVKNIKNNI